MTQKFLVKIVVLVAVATLVRGDDDLKDFEFSDDDEVMIAQESRQYQTVVKPPVRIIKPSGITNSHRPQYNLDSMEDLEFEITTKRTIAKDYKPSYKLRSKEVMIREAVLRALERRDHVGKFAQILPIVRSMSGSQRVALASLVASQVTTPPGRSPLNLAQVRSMFGNNANTTTDLMLPILLDMANLIRRAVRSGKEQREVKTPQAQILRRSFTGDDDIEFDDEPFETGDKSTQAPTTQKPRNRRIQLQRRTPITQNKTYTTPKAQENTTIDTKNITDAPTENKTEDIKNSTKSNVSAKIEVSAKKPVNLLRSGVDNSTIDLATDSTNQTLADLPVPEKLRSLNRYLDRKGNLIRRGSYPPKPTASRRTTAEPTLNPITRRRPAPARKLPSATPNEQNKCELFTNTLCLHSEDYPTDAIVQSIRRNKAAAGALLADFKDPGEGALDGVTAAQEAKYTTDHYLVSNRRGDTANRDFASAGEAGFMCPSTVKYARPQRARATSGQWKYIVNTGEHTQTLRLEKCLKPKEACTYLTDNFKSKCVQVYNYHRLLTWDQQNGLHMDIFKVPTCCSCHIEGYSVSFPPLGHRIHEAGSSEQFPEDLSSEHGNHAFESVQSSNQRPSVTKSPPFTRNKPLESFPPFSDTHNLITGTSFSNAKINDNDEYNSGNLPPTSPMDSYGNTYFPDSFNQASSIKSIKRPLSSRNPIGATGLDSVTLPSYLEPPTPSAPGSFSFIKETPSKYKITNSQFKRGAVRPNHRPIRKKISGAPDDLVSSGSTTVEEFSNTHIESLEDFNDDLEEPDTNIANKKIEATTKKVTIATKLHAAPTQEKSSTTVKPDEHNKGHDNVVNGKRVNYNYHPIIDFFGDEDQELENDSIDREDNESSFVSPESEWKPISLPGSRNSQTTSLVSRKKHK